MADAIALSFYAGIVVDIPPVIAMGLAATAFAQVLLPIPLLARMVSKAPEADATT